MNKTKTTLNNTDGSSTEIQLISADSPRLVFALFPAMGVYAKYYVPLAEELASKGFGVILADLRGNDTSSIRPKRGTDFSYTDVIHLDMETVISFAKESFPDTPTYLLGHSLGGQLSCLYAAKNINQIDGLVLSATCSVYYKGWKGFGAYQILAGTQFANLVAKTLGYFPGKKIGFGGIEAKSMIRDWSRQSRTGVYDLKNDSFDYETALSELKTPILSISYEGESLSPKGAVEHLLGKMKSADSEHIHLSKSDPRNDGYNHFNWAKKPEKLATLIDDWFVQKGL